MIKNIKLKDGVEVEVLVNDDQAIEIADGSIVNSSIDKVQELLIKVMKPISNTYQELSKDIEIENAKVTIGVNVGVEGNFILAKSSAGSNIKVEMSFKTK